VVLVRVLYAHAMVAAPRLALSWLSPLAPVLGDPRLQITGIFLAPSRVLPRRYPLVGDLQRYLDGELGFAPLLDVGVIRPRFDALYAWSAVELSVPELTGLIRDGVCPPTPGTSRMLSRGTRLRRWRLEWFGGSYRRGGSGCGERGAAGWPPDQRVAVTTPETRSSVFARFPSGPQPVRMSATDVPSAPQSRSRLDSAAVTSASSYP
jgi:hypothetical protein